LDRTKGDLWVASEYTPSELDLLGVELIGQTEDDGEEAYSHGFNYSCKCGNQFEIRLIAEASASDAQVEDMLLSAFERAMEQEFVRHQQQAGKLANDVSGWSKSLKLDVAEELRHIKHWMGKKKASSTGRTLYQGIK